jgi:two-component sensor histidine kinase
MALFRSDQQAGPASRAAEADSLEVLVDAVESLSAARSVADIAAVVRSAARRLSGADGVTVVLREGDQCHYLDEDAIAPLWKGRRFPLSACISGWVMLRGTTAVIPDIYVDDRIPTEAYRPTFVKSLVMTPVGLPTPQAAIGAYWAERRNPSSREIKALSAMARATATALENVRLIDSLEESVKLRDLLIRELDHRVNNTLATVQSLVRQSLKDETDLTAFETNFNARLAALAGAHRLLSLGAWKSTSLEDLARCALNPFIPGDAGRVQIEGPAVRLKPEAAVSVAMGLHELGANAAKYGALSNDDGQVRLSWTALSDDRGQAIELDWRESGSPLREAPAGRGVGRTLVEDALPRVLGGRAKMTFAPEGAHYHLRSGFSDRIDAA